MKQDATDIETFRYPKSLKIWARISAVVFGAISFIPIVSILDGHHDVIQNVMMAFPEAIFLYMLYMSVDAANRLDDIFTVNEFGLTVQAKGVNRVILWSEIKEVKSREVLQRIEIFDNHDERIAIIDYQLEGFDRLRDSVLAKKQRSSSRNNEDFITSWHLRGIFAALFIMTGFISIQALRQGESRALLVSALFMVLSIFGYMREIKRVIVGVDRVQIKSMVHSITVAYADITGVTLHNEKGPKGALIARVKILQSGQQPIELTYMQGGMIPLYQRLHERWLKSKGSDTVLTVKR